MKVTGKPVVVDVPNDSDDGTANKMELIAEKLHYLEQQLKEQNLTGEITARNLQAIE